MVDTTLPGVFLKGVAASRPAANAVAAGTVYSATDTGVITQSDGVSTWSTWATISSGMADPMTTRGDMIIRNAANATARLGRGSAAEVLTSDGTDIAWAAPASGAPSTADYLVGTAQGGLSAEIVVGATPGGELGGTWGTPTVDALHSGSKHQVELDYVEFTSSVSITATTDATQDTIVTGSAIAYDGSTIIMIEFQATDVDAQATSGTYTVIGLWDGSTHLGNIALFQTNATPSPAIPVHANRRLTPSAATHTYSIRAHTSAGTATIQVGAGGAATRMPGYIRITRV